jgi:hypothetical protein
MYSFNDRENEVLRFLKAEYLAKGERPATMHDKGTVHPDVIAKFNLSLSEYKEIVSRFEALGIVGFNHLAIESPNGLLHIKPLVVEIVRHLDDESLRKQSEPPNLLDKSKRWALSKWWIVGPVMVLLVVVWLINQFRPILEWFGVKR